MLWNVVKCWAGERVGRENTRMLNNKSLIVLKQHFSRLRASLIATISQKQVRDRIKSLIQTPLPRCMHTLYVVIQCCELLAKARVRLEMMKFMLAKFGVSITTSRCCAYWFSDIRRWLLTFNGVRFFLSNYGKFLNS